MDLIEEIKIPYTFVTFEDVIMCFSVFFFLFLIYLLMKLYKENKRLKIKIKKLEKEIDGNNKSINNRISSPKEQNNNLIKQLQPKKSEEKQEATNNKDIINNKPYQKNVLRNIKAPVSPININREGPTIKELKMNLNDFIKKERKNGNNIKILTSKDYNNRNSSVSYIEEVSKRLEAATDNNPIELTDYEKKQEREAIISYKELIENKDKINIVDDEADIEFINQLKKFRDDLNKK